MTDHSSYVGQTRRLVDIVREVKVAAAERSDVVVDMRDADRARLELLAQELQSVIRDVPAEDEQFDFAVSSGLQPRFWIDAVAHVHMGRDLRTYRFVRDTRLGRTLIAETSELAAMADSVSRYIAERVIQRQRVLDGDFETLRISSYERPEPARPAASNAATPAPAPVPAAANGDVVKTSVLLRDIAWLLFGAIVGGAALIAAFWDRLAG